MRDGIPIAPNETPSIINGDGDINGFPSDRLPRHQPEIIMIDEDMFGPAPDYDG
jgi:hypothetical protein